MKIKALFFGLLLAISHSSFAEMGLWSGNDLFPYFLSYESVSSGRANDIDISKMAGYLGYIRGVYEVWTTMTYSSPDKKMCIDRAITLQQMGSVVGQYLRQNPNELHQAAFALVVASLTKAFPCPKP